MSDGQKKKKVDDSAVKKGRRTSSASLGVLDGNTSKVVSEARQTDKQAIDVIPEKKEKMIQGVYVRSQKLPVITKQALQQKLLKTLADLDIGTWNSWSTCKNERAESLLTDEFTFRRTTSDANRAGGAEVWAASPLDTLHVWPEKDGG